VLLTERNEVIENYFRECRRALERFRDISWRCEAMSDEGRCLNYWTGHEKGHQFSRLPHYENDRRPNDLFGGPRLLVGEFQCSFNPEEVLIALYTEIERLRTDGGYLDDTVPLVSKASGVVNVNGNRTCFTCLSECPVYILPCEGKQHSICETCAFRFSSDRGRSQSTLFLKCCPFGCQFRNAKPWQIRLKPRTAGVRMLSLDGCVFNPVQFRSKLTIEQWRGSRYIRTYDSQENRG
jgi:hypothetical protein